MLDFVNEQGVRVMDEDAIEALTAIRKVRPARGAFGDWNQYDADGNARTVVAGTQIVSENDDLFDDRGYGTQTEQRMAERGDDQRYDAASRVWFTRKGDRVELRTEHTPRTYLDDEKQFADVPYYHSLPYGYRLQCWYCGGVFDALTFCKQDGEVTPEVMRHFAKEALVHSAECRTEHGGLPLIRMRDYNGRPVLRRASHGWGGKRTVEPVGERCDRNCNEGCNDR